MSILKKPYEISVWDDVWQSDKFVEKRLGIIGTDTMTSLNRALEPNLVRNVNGIKKFSFKMYKKYIDPITGKKVNNPFVDWLVSERKVKLKYDGEWYDFIVKNVNENSTNYLYTYQLEDALVQELSKNGFGVTLDANLNNNMGSADYLARTVLEETDWEVPTECEKLVQTVSEALIYLNVKEDGFKATRLIDQTKQELTKGVQDGGEIEIAKDKTILAFYSSCINKPYRFQFIYLDDADIKTDVERNIINENCQYYSDNLTYIEDTENGYWLPNGLEVLKTEEDGVESILSTKYRGKRYGFAQQAVYLPVLERYVNVFDKNGEVYYGYEHAEYVSPALTQNLISNSTFESTSGWTGTKINEDGSKPKIEAVCGRFENKQFISVIEDIKNGKFSSANSYKTYLQVEWPENGESSILLNSCIYDNRILLGNITTNDEFALKISCVNNEGKPYNNYNCVIGNYTYDPGKDKYSKDNNIIFASAGTKGEYNIYKVTSSNYTEKTFKKSNIRLGIIFNSMGTYYIDGAELFKAHYINNQLITPEKQAESLEDRAVNKSYYFFSIDHANSLKNKEDFKAEKVCTTIDYATYKPVFNTGAEKIRSVTAKESNYFNILQSIAETFEAWLELKIERNDDGSINKKIVQFKNYVGQDNYAGFRYGVNLKDIQRTYESKNIVTKLMVKQNSNEYGENGFCTIARAGANPTGEAHIYDFQYYQNKGLMNASEYLKSNYVLDGAKGEDASLWKSSAITWDGTSTNLQGYFPRLKAINNILKKETDLLLNAAKDLTQYEAEYEIADAGYLAAKSGIEEVREKFELLTNQSIDNLSGIDTERTDIAKLLREYAEYLIKERQYSKERLSLRTESYDNKDTWGKLDKAENEYKEIQERIDKYKGWKSKLNKLFFSKYSRFIQEGTWINEEYMDDDKYYADSLSVLYNSCYPQVAYSINVLELSKLPGYELFKVGLGDKTYAEDPEFFGTDLKEEVIVSELSENLDNPSKNLVKVQNFKNQFQDLFQKITATVQQTQYNEGSYKKGAALAEANQERKQQFLSNALDSASARLTAAGQQSVTWGNDGITVKSVNSPSDMVRMVGGAIMLSKQDKNGQQKWVTGITSDGISADLINAGTVNTNNINIMNADEPVFKWDSYGISAFDSTWTNSEIGTTLSAIDTKKFVRFDKHGIYGINNAGIDGEKWKPTAADDIDNKATFSLTWAGLKIVNKYDDTDDEGNQVSRTATAQIGKDSDSIIKVNNGKKDTLIVDKNGNVKIDGELEIGDQDVEGDNYSWKFDQKEGLFMWSGPQEPENLVLEVKEEENEETEEKTKKLKMHGSIYSNDGEIANWKIKEDGIFSQEGSTALISSEDDKYLYPSLKEGQEESLIRYQSGTRFVSKQRFVKDTHPTNIINNIYYYEETIYDPKMSENSLDISDMEVVFADNGSAQIFYPSSIEIQFTYVENVLRLEIQLSRGIEEYKGLELYSINFNINYTVKEPATLILEDGSFYTEAGLFRGEVQDLKGTIGQLQFNGTSSGIYGNNYYMSRSGLQLTNNQECNLGPFTISYKKNLGTLEGKYGTLSIKTKDGGGIELTSRTAIEVSTKNINLSLVIVPPKTGTTFSLYLKSSDTLYQTIFVPNIRIAVVNINSGKVTYSSTAFTIYGGKSKSTDYKLSISSRYSENIHIGLSETTPSGQDYIRWSRFNGYSTESEEYVLDSSWKNIVQESTTSVEKISQINLICDELLINGTKVNLN